MKRLERVLGGILLSLGLLGSAAGAEAPGCPGADALMTSGNYLGAETEARKCLQADGSGWQVRLVLAKALGYQEKYDDGLTEVARVRAEAPQNSEAVALQVRLLYWKGEVEQAYQTLQGLTGEGADLESALLAGDVAAAAGHPEAAEPWYWAAGAKGAQRSEVLVKIARLRELQGQKESAAQLLNEACELGEEASPLACAQLKENPEPVNELRWLIGAQPGIMFLTDRPDAWNLTGIVGHRPVDSLFVTLSGDLRSRDYGEGMKRDLFLLATAAYRASATWGVDAGVGGTVARVFSPTFTLYVEPWYRVAHSLVASLKLWHLQFGDTPIEVVSPHVDWYFGDFMLDVRYYLSIADSGMGHAVTGKLHWFAGPLRPSLGAGVGDKADYLDSLEQDGGFFWFVSAGLAYRLPTDTHLTLDYMYRDESVSDQAYQFHQIQLGVYQWF